MWKWGCEEDRMGVGTLDAGLMIEAGGVGKSKWGVWKGGSGSC